MRVRILVISIAGVILSISLFTYASLASQASPAPISAPTPSLVACVDPGKSPSQTAPAGAQCAALEFARKGKPLLSAATDGVAFGVSVPPGKAGLIYIWMDNQTDEQKYYLACCRATFLERFDIYDSSGQRILNREEEKDRNACFKGSTFALECTCSGLVEVKPHTMQIVDSGDIADGYSLQPGLYALAPAQKTDVCDAIRANSAPQRNGKPRETIQLTIPGN